MGVDDLLVEARAAVLGQQRPGPCDVCEGSVLPGVLHRPVVVEGEVGNIQRCDACGLYGSDVEAALGVAAHIGEGARAYYLHRPGDPAARDRRYDPWVQRGTPPPAPEGLELGVVTAAVVPNPESARAAQDGG